MEPAQSTHTDAMKESADKSESTKYWRFGAMIGTAMVAMFALTYVNSYELDHIHFSETRLYMTLVMGAAMAVIMLGFMLGMYRDRKVNLAIVGASLLVFVGAIWLVRSQATVDDSSYMSAMIPHHSIAILTSERAGIEDLRVRELADGIIDAQKREIAEMEWLLADIAGNGLANTSTDAEARPAPDFDASG